MGIAGLYPAIVAYEYHLSVTPGVPHFFNDAVGAGVDIMRMTCGQIDAVMTACAVMTVAKS